MTLTNIDWMQTFCFIALLVIIVFLACFRKKIILYFRRLLFSTLFNEKEAETVILAIDSKRSAKKYWYFNNIITPIAILYSPYILTRVSKDFGVISFDKSFIQLTLTGAFTMIGINVMRSSLISVNESIQRTHVNDESLFEGLIKDVESIKSKLRSWILFFTLFGTLAYFIQVANFIDPNKTEVYPYFAVVIILFLISISFGRLITVVQTNFLDDRSLVEAFVSSLSKNHTEEFNSLKEETKGGLL